MEGKSGVVVTDDTENEDLVNEMGVLGGLAASGTGLGRVSNAETSSVIEAIQRARFTRCLLALATSPVVPSVHADIQIQAVGGGKGGQQVLHDAHGILLGREQEVAQGHQAAAQAHVPEQARDHRPAGASGRHELDQPAHAEQGRASQANELPGRGVQARPAQPQDFLVHDAHDLEPALSSLVAVTWLRWISQATPIRSRMPTRARPRLVYLDWPDPRDRWETGTLRVFQPARCISAGR